MMLFIWITEIEVKLRHSEVNNQNENINRLQNYRDTVPATNKQDLVYKSKRLPVEHQDEQGILWTVGHSIPEIKSNSIQASKNFKLQQISSKDTSTKKSHKGLCGGGSEL